MIEEASPRNVLITGWRIACIATIIVSIVAYLPSMSGLAIWDDHSLIGGSGIGGGKSLAACFTEPFLMHYFRPLVSVSFYLDHKMSGSGPFFYHQTNLLIHAATTLICILLFREAFKSRVMAIAGALAFAVQPAQVSTVAWIGGRTDSLCTLFVTLFAWSLIRSVRTQGSISTRWSALSVISFGLALFTKEQSISLLPVVPLAWWCFGDMPARTALLAGMRRAVPYGIVSCAFVAAWLAFYPAPHPPVMHGVGEQAALAGRTITYYTELLAIPTPTSMHLLSVATLERWGIWSVLPGYAIVIAAIVFIARNIRRNPAAAWFCGFVLAGMLPVSNLVPLPSLVVAPYRVGVCGPAAAALLALLFTATWKRAFSTAFAGGDENSQRAPSSTDGPDSPANVPATGGGSIVTFADKTARLRLAMGCAALLWCAGLTYWGAGRWQDELMVFQTIVRYDPDSIVARFNLTTALLKLHKGPPALRELDQLMTRLYRSRDWLDRNAAINDLNTDPRILVRIRENQGNAIRPELWLAALYGQRGFALLDARDDKAARQSFEIGITIDRFNDDVNLGLARMAYDAGDMHKAVGYLRVVIAASPRRPEARMLFGHTLAGLGRWRAARAELQTWATLQPWSGQAQVEVAQADCRLGDYDGAKATLEYALAHSICDVEEVRARLKDLHGRAAAFLN